MSKVSVLLSQYSLKDSDLFGLYKSLYKKALKKCVYSKSYLSILWQSSLNSEIAIITRFKIMQSLNILKALKSLK